MNYLSNRSKSMKRLFIGAALTAMIAPISSFAIDIGGPTAKDWVDAGSANGIAVTLIAIPAKRSPFQPGGII